MRHAAAAGEDVLCIDRDDRAAVITHDFLHLPIDGTAAVRDLSMINIMMAKTVIINILYAHCVTIPSPN